MATSDVNNTIMLSVSREAPRLQLKYNSATAARPGNVLMMTWDADNNKMLELQPYTDTPAQPIICVENTRMGKNIDDTYTLGETIYAVHPRRGDIVLITARFASATTATVGMWLTCFGSGYAGEVHIDPPLGSITEYTGILARCIEEKTAAPGARALVKAEVF